MITSSNDYRDANAPDDDEPHEGEALTTATAPAPMHPSAPPASPPAHAPATGPERPRTPPPSYADVIEEDRKKMDIQ